MYLGYSAGTYTTPHLGDNEAKKAPIVMRREPMTIMAHSRITIPVGRSLSGNLSVLSVYPAHML